MGLASELRHKVKIEVRGEGGRDENGFVLPSSWIPYKTLWAKITPVSARDLALVQSEVTEVTARMKIRYRTDINTAMRVLWKDKIYSIVSEGLDDNEDGYTYTTFNLSYGIEITEES